jgi:Flp pilus assembly CpaE family ATPase
VGAPVLHTVPSDYRTAMRALNKGRPLALDNHNKLAASFRELAHDVAGLKPSATAPEASGGLFRLLKGRR